MLKFIKFLPVVVLAIIIGVIIFFLNQPSPKAATDAKIKWNPVNITNIISPGGSKSVEVSFVATKDLNNVKVFVVPELQPFVQVSPSSFSHVSAGTVTSLTIMFSAPSDAKPGAFNGTIHIISMGKNARTYEKPLPIILNIWNRSEIKINNLIVEFAYPPGWNLSRHGFGTFIYNPINSQPGDELTPPDITIQVLENELCLPLRDYIVEYKEGWYSLYHNISEVTILGHQAILVNDLEAFTPKTPIIAAFIGFNCNVVSVLARETSQEQFFEILESLNFP